MSGDLISRSALIEQLRAEGNLNYLVKGAIDNAPTAYNIIQVIEKLEDEKGIAFLTLANTGDKVKDAVYDEVMAYLNTAIEIVKAGGVE